MTDIQTGLTQEQVRHKREQFGLNQLSVEKKETLFHKILGILKEPTFVLLLSAATIYFVLGEFRDGFVMLAFVVSMMGIEIWQEIKTDKTLQALKDLSAPTIAVMRESEQETIPSIELVPGDIMVIEEGLKIPADGWVVRANDLSVDESTLTGESVAVTKLPLGDEAAYLEGSDHWRADYVYAGTLVQQGFATIEVEHTGLNTEFGKIGTQIMEVPDRPTPLEKQTAKLVKVCAVIALTMALLVAALTYLGPAESAGLPRVFDAILAGITIAMSLIPEEFPVILTIFLSLGAARLARHNSLVRRLNAVETLGAISVLCSDKTGTITKNKMELTDVWALPSTSEEHLLHTMGLACETDAYDPMEKAMLAYDEAQGITSEHLFGGTMLHEYPFTNETKMMGHVWDHEGEIVIAAKGSPEHILSLCAIDEQSRVLVTMQLDEMANRGLRVIAIATQKLADTQSIPEHMDVCELTLEGLVGLSDPPREHVAQHIATCQRAGVRVIMITGDNGTTASAIARQIGLANADQIVTGDELSHMNDEELREAVRTTAIFSRVIPEHKMRIVQALQDDGEVVAMTGDGVNDAPALKNADIGIAMGKRGSEVAREAADLILLDDNFGTIVETIKNGRRIYDNIKKAVGYVFTVHIPIAFAAFVAPLLQVSPRWLMIMPIHVLMLELVIDPTCSVVLEREPAERGIMDRPPRRPDASILTRKLLTKAVIQGVVIALTSFFSYYYLLTQTDYGAPIARAVGLGIMLIASMVLVFVNSSESDHALKNIKKLSGEKIVMGAVVAVITLLLLAIYSPLNSLFAFAPLPFGLLAYTFAAGSLSVLWYEIVKMITRHKA